MNKYLIFILLLFSMFIIKVNAAGTIVENYETEYNISIPQDIIDLSLVLDQQGTTLQEFLQTIIDTESPYYGIKINLRYSSINSLNQIGLSLYDQSIDNFEISTFGRNTSNTSLQSSFMNPQTKDTFQQKAYNISISSTLPANIYQNTTYINFQLCYLSNDCNISNTPTRWGNQFSRYSTNTYFNNNNSYNITKTSGNDFNLYYYLSDTMTLKNDFCDTSSTYTCYMKTIKINDVTYNIGDVIPTYYDLYLAPPSSPSFIPYQLDLGAFLVGGISKANINNFKIDLSFNYEEYNTFNINTKFFGRKDNTSYYSYEPLNCSSLELISLAYDTENNNASGSIYPNGFSCSSDLTDYDNIYLFIQLIPTQNANSYVISNLVYSSNYGNIKNFDNTFITSNDVEIYEPFTNVSSTSSFLFSSLKSRTNLYYTSDNEYNVLVAVNQTTNDVDRFSVNPLTFGIAINKNALLYSYENNNSYNLNLFFNSRTIMSISSNGTYTYYDDTGTITTDTIINDVIVNKNSYDVSYYFVLVNNYIDSLESDMVDFHNVVQNTYDLIPEPFNIMIVTLFIFGCLYIVWNLIKK